jgi:hypothetical protein
VCQILTPRPCPTLLFLDNVEQRVLVMQALILKSLEILIGRVLNPLLDAANLVVEIVMLIETPGEMIIRRLQPTNSFPVFRKSMQQIVLFTLH